MAPAPKVGQTIVPLFTNQGDSRPPKVDKTMVLAKISTVPPGKVGEIIVHIVPVPPGENDQTINSQSLRAGTIVNNREQSLFTA